jgi:hypothetical protein
VTGAASMEAAAIEYAVAGAEALSREQFELFYNRTAPALRAYIRRVSVATGSVDDLLQEAYARILNAPPLTEAQRKIVPLPQRHKSDYRLSSRAIPAAAVVGTGCARCGSRRLKTRAEGRISNGCSC